MTLWILDTDHTSLLETVSLCEAVSLYLEIRVSNPDTLEKVVDRRILGY